MTKKISQMEKLVEILKVNQGWPLIVEGLDAQDFAESPTIQADCDASELALIPTEKGYIFPKWLSKLVKDSKEFKNVFLCISGLDTVSFELQERFYGLLKYKGLNGMKLPENTQIVIVANHGGIENISQKIKSLTISFVLE